ncbi:myelin-oligodendrocyte glycoprotein isoform X6 [Choloepus didactylus]|uniref:myelin-oligodendrocyte glycoprotein isoform X6 n=1 Tax=Choloepus didactylus TaxID=27675 RepID=UPI00189F2CDF|nr:myelin-oligodendrocyte glycoprotein isoform X6 [Choloepus didactylus]
MASLQSPSLPSCLPPLLLLLLQLSSSYAGQFRVIGPGHPIRSLVGDEAELPCRISPGKNATGMEVGWYRPPFSRVVHLYRNGKDQDGEQAPEYRGRTELLKDSIGEGKVTLRIRNVRFSDEGGFTCFFRDHSYQEEAAMELKVEDHRRPRLPLPAAETERESPPEFWNYKHCTYFHSSGITKGRSPFSEGALLEDYPVCNCAGSWTPGCLDHLLQLATSETGRTIS